MTMPPKKENASPLQAREGVQEKPFSSWVLALCFLSLTVVYFVTQDVVLLQLSILAFIVPLMLVLRQKRVSGTRALRSFAYCIPYLFFVSLSIFFNLSDTDQLLNGIVMLLNLSFSFLMAAVFASYKKGDFLRETMRRLMIPLCGVFLYVLIAQRHAFVWGRWEPYDLQPNWWGAIALGLGWAAMAWEKNLPRFIGIALSFLFMFLVQSRGTIAAFLPALLLGSGYFFPITQKKVMSCFLAFVGFLIVAFCLNFVFSLNIIDKGTDFIANAVFKMDDPLRGVHSGLSGRVKGYEEAWEDFLESPLFGNGFLAYKHVHNGYLKTLAESGLFAFLGMMFIFWAGLWGHVKTKNYLGIGIVVSYMVFLMTFPRTFNMNMTSLLLSFSMMQGISNRLLQKTARRETKSG